MADPAAAALAMAHQQRLQVHLSAAQNAAGSGSPADLIQYFTATNPNAASVLKNLVPAQQADLARRLQELSRTQPLANAAMVGLQPTTMAAPQQAANAVGRPVAVVQGKPGSFPGTAPGVSNQIPVMTAAALHSQLRPGMGIAGIPGLQGVGLPQLALGPNGQIMTLTNQGVILGQRPTLASTAMQQQALNLAGITKQQAVAAAVVQQQANQEALARQQSQQLYLAQQRQQAQAVQQQFQARSGAANAASPPPDASRAMMSGGKQHQNAAGTFSLPIVKPSSPHDIGSPNTPKASQGMNGHGVVSLQAALQQINAAHAAADAVAVMRANNRSEELSKRLKSESGAYPSPSASMTGNGGASDDARIKVEQAMSNEVEQAGKTKVQRLLEINQQLIREMQDYKTHNWPEDAEYYAYLTRYEQNMTYLTQAADYLNKPDPDYEYPTPPPTPDLSPVKSSSRSLALRRTESANSGDEVKVKAEARASLAQASSDNPLKRGHGALDDSREPPEIEALKRSISLAGGNATNGGQHANDDPLEAFRRAAGDAFDPSGMANLPRVPSAPPAESPSSSIYPSPAIGYSPMADYAKLGGAMSPSSNPLPKPRQTAAAIAAALQAATAKAPSPGAKPGTLNSPSSSAAPTPIQPIAIPNLAAMQSSANSPIPAAIGTPNLGTVWGRRLSITGGNAAGGLGTPISVGVLGSPQLPGTNTAQALLFSQFQPAGQASPVTAEPQQQQPTAQLFSLDLAGTGAAGLANAPNLANISFTLDAQQRAMLQRQAMQQQFQQQQFQQQQFQQQQLQQQQLQQHQLQQQQLQAAIASSGQQAAAEAAARANAVAASAARASPVQPPAPIANPEKPPEPELNFDDFFGDGEEENGTGDGTWKQGADMSISFGSDPIEPAGAAGNSTAQGLSATDAMAATTRGASQSNLDMTLQGMFNTELFGDDLAMMRGGEDGSLLGLDLIDEDGNKWA